LRVREEKGNQGVDRLRSFVKQIIQWPNLKAERGKTQTGRLRAFKRGKKKPWRK